MSRCKYCPAEITWVVMVSGRHMAVEPGVVEGNGRRTLVVRHSVDGQVRGHVVQKAGPHLRGYVPHSGRCPGADKARKPASPKAPDPSQIQLFATS